MGSATTQALTATNSAVSAATAIDLETARELFAAARIIDGSLQLRGALADPSASVASRTAVIAAVFGPTFQPTTVSLLTTAVGERWSNASDLIDAIEELGIRATSIAAEGADIEGELFGFSRTIAENPELELALGSRLGDESAKGALVEKLLGSRVSAGATLIVASLVQLPRDRRVRQLLTRAMNIVADQRNRTVATVVTAKPLSGAQAEKLAAVLTKKYGRPVSINTFIDPSVVGGLRVQIADDVIDASISARLADLRQKIAG